MPSAISRPEASTHAKRITAGIEDTTRELLADGPQEAVESLFGINVTVHPAEHRTAGSCGVHGLYTPATDGSPPKIELTKSLSRRRDGFTILHELGHHLIRGDATTVDQLYDLPPLEKKKSHELVADAIAGRLLVTDADVAEAFEYGVTAGAVRHLFDISNASREACCVRGADSLTQRGAVMLLRDNVAVFTSHRSTPWHVARDTPQADDGLFSRAVDNTGHVTGETTVRFASGGTSTSMYGNAIACDDGWVFAVLTLDRPAAGGLTIPLAKFVPEDAVECITCGISFTPWGKPCVCGDRKCPIGHCSCDKGPPTRLCQGCFLQKHVDLFDEGSDLCRDTCS